NGNEREQIICINEQNEINNIANDDEYYHYFGGLEKSQNIFFFVRNHYLSSEFQLCVKENRIDSKIKTLRNFDSPIKILEVLNEKELLITVEKNNLDEKIYRYIINEGKLIETSIPQGRLKQLVLLDNFNKGYMVNDLGNEYLNLYEVNIETGSCENLTNIQNDVEEIQVSNDKKKILFSVNKDGFSKLYVYD